MHYLNYNSFFVLILYIGIKYCDCLICLSCTKALSARDCTFVQKCGPSEECFTDQYVSTNGRILFDFGCRTPMDCQNPLVGKRSDSVSDERSAHDFGDRSASDYGSSYIHTCGQCCVDQLCNAQLCGQAGFNGNLGPLCYNCPAHQRPDSCDEIKQCGRDQVCQLQRFFSNNNIVEYNSKCTEKTACDVAVQHVSQFVLGRRSTNQVGSAHDCFIKCCDTTLCNTGVCLTGNTSTLPVSLTTPSPFTPSGHDHCTSNPCVYGNCFNGQSSYVCQCNGGYSGHNCDQLVDHCASSPCLHGGTCTNSANTYSCRCTYNYHGHQCEQTDHCASSPCMHGGTCTNSASTYSCSCTSSYHGQQCEQRVIVDHCASSPCLHGSTCTNSASTYSCTCTSEYHGHHCELTVGGCSSNRLTDGSFEHGANGWEQFLEGFTVMSDSSALDGNHYIRTHYKGGALVNFNFAGPRPTELYFSGYSRVIGATHIDADRRSLYGLVCSVKMAYDDFHHSSVRFSLSDTWQFQQLHIKLDTYFASGFCEAVYFDESHQADFDKFKLSVC